MTKHFSHIRFIKTLTRKLVPGILSLVVLGSCTNDMAEVRALTSGTNMQVDRAEDVTIIHSKENNVKMRAFAKEFLHNSSAKPAYIDMNGQIKAEFYSDSGTIETILTADSSRYYEVDGNVIVWGHVLVTTEKGEKLETPELIWNAGAQKFFTEKDVTITTATEVINGTGMEANSDFSWYRIVHPRGTVQVNKKEMPQ